MKIIFSTLVLIILASTGLAGTCLENAPPVVNYYRSEAVFIGKILNIKRYYGIPRTDENWNIKYKVVEFEVQKSFKGTENGQRIKIINPFGSMDWEDLKLKKGRRWAVFANRLNGNLIVFNDCGAWSETIDTETELAEWDEHLLSLQNQIERDKQAVGGRVKNWGYFKGIENLEIKIDSNDRLFSVFTDKEGLFYLPVPSPGKYKITIKFPRRFLLPYDIVKIPSEYLDDAVNKDTLIYKIDLKPGEFLFSQFNIQFF